MQEFKINSIVIDTINSPQDTQYLKDLQNVIEFNKWKDYGVDLATFMAALTNTLGFIPVFIVGDPGTGKSYGMKHLEPGTFIWFNTDKKDASWEVTEEFYNIYGTVYNPGPLMHKTDSYKEIIDKLMPLKQGIKTANFSVKLEPTPVAFILCHSEEYKGANDTIKRRIKTLGNLATKLGVDSKSLYSLWTVVKPKAKGADYSLSTQNSGWDTARSVEGMFPMNIPNSFKEIRDKVIQRAQNPFPKNLTTKQNG